MLGSFSALSRDKCKSISPCFAKTVPRSPGFVPGTSFASIMSIISQLSVFHSSICLSRSLYNAFIGFGFVMPFVRIRRYCCVQTVLVPFVSFGL